MSLTIVFAHPCADVAELADALVSGTSVRKDVEVQVLSSAPTLSAFLLTLKRIDNDRFETGLCWPVTPFLTQFSSKLIG